MPFSEGGEKRDSKGRLYALFEPSWDLIFSGGFLSGRSALRCRRFLILCAPKISGGRGKKLLTISSFRGGGEPSIATDRPCGGARLGVWLCVIAFRRFYRSYEVNVWATGLGEHLSAPDPKGKRDRRGSRRGRERECHAGRGKRRLRWRRGER